MKDLEEKRKVYCFNREGIQKILEKKEINPKLENHDKLIQLFHSAYDIDENKFLHQDQIKKILHINKTHLNSAIVSARRKLRNSKNIVLFNQRGIGYKFSKGGETIFEDCKAMARAYNYLNSFVEITEAISNGYDLDSLYLKSKDYYDMFVAINITSNFAKSFLESRSKNLALMKNIKKLVDRAHDEVSAPIFE